jgi:hypothetical protein
MPYDPEALAAELDVLMQRADLEVPPERKAQVVVAYAELREQVARLRGRPATAEPSNVFRLQRMPAR